MRVHCTAPDHRTVVVDIGNSGLKAAAVDFSLGTPQLSDPLRIPWQHAKNRTSSPQRQPQQVKTLGSPATPQSWSPTDVRWLSTLDEWYGCLQNPEGSEDETLKTQAQPTHWLLSGVHRAAMQLLAEHLASQETSTFQIVDFREIPLQLDVQYPEQVGVDRLLAAHAAVSTTSVLPLLVIQVGSAVTIDLVTSSDASPYTSDAAADDSPLATFCGGLIMPGFPMLIRLLGQAADLLPSVETMEDLVQLPDLPGKNTVDAMRCGAASALVGGVQHAVARYREQYGSQLPVVISGGDGPRLSPHIIDPVHLQKQLVLQGLSMLAARQRNQ